MRLSGAGLFLFLFLLISGCTAVHDTKPVPVFHLSEDGSLSLEVPLVKPDSALLIQSDNVSVEEITFPTFAGNVSSVLVTPEKPVAALVWAPGAGVAASGHIDHLKEYAKAGYAVLVVDIRGNGGKTPGYPLDLQTDYQILLSGKWPQIYLIVSDLITAEHYLHSRFGSIPVWAVGESNGGRYAAQAVASDSDFSGYVGISTSGFDRQGDQYTGSARSFLLSVDPEAFAGKLLSRPSLIFHAPDDPIIPISSGMKLASLLGGKSRFISFNGTHGVNGEVDLNLIRELDDRYL